MVRPVIFLAYSGEMRWRTRAGDEITATLGTPMTKDQIAQAWRTALDPAGEWVSRVLEAADKRLTEVRRGMPDAGGLVIAGDHEDARAYAGLLRGLTGRRPVVVLSDDKTASKKISSFAASDERWMVAVRMVSEGVDIPRLAVGVYATSVSTALFFAQAVGRFVRARQRGETASVFVPSVPVLLSYAAELEAERDHVLRSALAETPEDELALAEAQRERDTPEVFHEPAFQALNASAHFDRVLYDGGEFGTATAVGSPEEEDFLGLPGLLDPDQVRTLLRKRQDAQIAARSRAAKLPTSPASPASRRLSRLSRYSCLSCLSRYSCLSCLLRLRLSRHSRLSRPRAYSDNAADPSGCTPGEPPGPRRAAEGTQRPGRRLEPPDRPAARGHPRRTTPHLRRPAAAASNRRPDPHPHRHHPPLGHLWPLAAAPGPVMVGDCCPGEGSSWPWPRGVVSAVVRVTSEADRSGPLPPAGGPEPILCRINPAKAPKHQFPPGIKTHECGVVLTLLCTLSHSLVEPAGCATDGGHPARPHGGIRLMPVMTYRVIATPVICEATRPARSVRSWSSGSAATAGSRLMLNACADRKGARSLCRC